ncbi:hypothetical protein RIF29_14714 [Crotalaria pallida]|uniref:Uncharacterized protein n=1 Tax=Crotalaria pallida TaxID=3830 RepID=A0AAN9IIJ3_CROPI
MSKGHTIPLLDFARLLLLRHNTAVTIFTTPKNRPFVAQSLHGTAASIVTLPFPTATDIPAGVESTDELPSISLFFKFANSTEAMQPHFEHALEHTLPRPNFMVTDAFLWWTLQSATKFSVPRFVYFGMSCYSTCLLREAVRSGILGGPQPDDELVELTRFPWIKICKEDIIESKFKNRDENDVAYKFKMKITSATTISYGIVVNSFYELEPVFVDYLNNESSPKSWCVGPFCIVEQASKIYLEPGVYSKCLIT